MDESSAFDLSAQNSAMAGVGAMGRAVKEHNQSVKDSFKTQFAIDSAEHSAAELKNEAKDFSETLGAAKGIYELKQNYNLARDTRNVAAGQGILKRVLEMQPEIAAKNIRGLKNKVTQMLTGNVGEDRGIGGTNLRGVEALNDELGTSIPTGSEITDKISGAVRATGGVAKDTIASGANRLTANPLIRRTGLAGSQAQADQKFADFAARPAADPTPQGAAADEVAEDTSAEPKRYAVYKFNPTDATAGEESGARSSVLASGEDFSKETMGFGGAPEAVAGAGPEVGPVTRALQEGIARGGTAPSVSRDPRVGADPDAVVPRDSSVAPTRSGAGLLEGERSGPMRAGLPERSGFTGKTTQLRNVDGSIPEAPEAEEAGQLPTVGDRPTAEVAQQRIASDPYLASGLEPEPQQEEAVPRPAEAGEVAEEGASRSAAASTIQSAVRSRQAASIAAPAVTDVATVGKDAAKVVPVVSDSERLAGNLLRGASKFAAGVGVAGGVISAGSSVWTLSEDLFDKGYFDHLNKQQQHGNEAGIIGGALDAASLIAPILAPIAIGTSIYAAVEKTMGEHTAGDPKTKADKVKEEGQFEKTPGSVQTLSSMGLVSSAPVDIHHSISGTSSF